MIEAGWKLPEIDESDYFYLFHLLGEDGNSSSPNDIMAAEDFFASLGATI